MFYIQKILLALLSPVSVILILLFLGVIKRKWSIVLFTSIILFLFSLPITSNQLIKIIESGHQQIAPKKGDEKTAIVVLSGYLSIINTPQGNQFQWGGADRFFKGIELANLNASSFLIFTNEQLPWNKDSPSIAKFLISQSEMLGIKRNRILFTTPVHNTQDEALAVARLGIQKGFHKVILVTSAFHMQRAQLLFEKAGLEVTPFPTDFRMDARQITILDLLPSASGLAGSEFAIREMIGRLYYQFTY